MNIRSSITIFIFSLLPLFCDAQDLNSKILLTVDGKKSEAGEFIRMYKKSIEPGKNQNPDEYLKQFVIFKLKVADAMRLGYDTTKAFKTELNGYRTQLAQNYLTDSQTKDKLIKSAYQRSLTEINAWHILIALPPDASPADTLKAWEKARDVRVRILSGEPFENVAKSASDDKSVMSNGGNLGYFTVFQMIMPFEDAAYSMKKGEISQPVRTPYGYHIIRVTDKRPSRGRIKVAHIMKASPPGTADADAVRAKEKIFEIYKKLQAGTSFREMAKTLSDHKESAVKGGELEWFGSGEIISDFSEAAFAIKDTGKYSMPVQTPYGWHIIKLLDRQPPKTFEDSKSFLESRINQSYLNSLSKKSFVEKLKKEYKFRINQEAFNWFVQNTDTLVIQGLRKYERATMPDGNLYTFSNQVTTTKDFANYIEKRGNMVATTDSVIFINQSIETKASDQLISYENSLLEKKNPEFRYLMNEFHDGILLFEVSGKKVWNRVNEDSTGLRKYYEDHKNNYLTQPGINAKIYTLRRKDAEKTLASAWKKYSGKNNRDNLLEKKFNKKTDSLLIITEGRWLRGNDRQLDSLKWAVGSQALKRGGYPAIINITGLVNPVPLSFEEVEGEMMTGYQDYLERTWAEQLKEKYTVKIDNMVLGEVKKKLGI
jgi:peptidyl-prolyl cis-trans isomerase SurA